MKRLTAACQRFRRRRSGTSPKTYPAGWTRIRPSLCLNFFGPSSPTWGGLQALRSQLTLGQSRYARPTLTRKQCRPRSVFSIITLKTSRQRLTGATLWSVRFTATSRTPAPMVSRRLWRCSVTQVTTEPAVMKARLPDMADWLSDPFALPDGKPATKRDRGGRPPSVRAFRSGFVRFRVLPSEKIRLTAASRRAGYPDLSSWSRGLLLSAAEGESTPRLSDEVLAEIARLRRDIGSGVGSNLNQAMAHANAAAKAGQAVDAEALSKAVRDAHTALDGLRGELTALLRPRGLR